MASPLLKERVLTAFPHRRKSLASLSVIQVKLRVPCDVVSIVCHLWLLRHLGDKLCHPVTVLRRQRIGPLYSSRYKINNDRTYLSS